MPHQVVVSHDFGALFKFMEHVSFHSFAKDLFWSQNSHSFDVDFPDERISFEVFLPIYQAISKSRTSDTADDFIEGLRHFDKDGNGFISSAELRHLLTTLGKWHLELMHLQ